MESRNEIPIDAEILQKVTHAFKNKFTTEFEEALTTILEQHRDSLRPLTGYYISAKKGKKQLSNKIAKDAINKFIEVFAVDFIVDMINSPLLNQTLKTLDESGIGIGLGVDSKGNPKFDLDVNGFWKQYFVKFVVKKGIPPKTFYEKMIFETSVSGGFYDMHLIDTLWNNRSLNLGDLGGDFLISVVKLPFIHDYEINQRMYDKYAGIELKNLTVIIPKFVMNST